MAGQLLVDLDVDGQARVGVVPDGGMYEQVSSEPVAWPVGDGDLEDLRWYLEDYLQAPYGVWEERGPRVQAALAGWGEQVFATVFGGGPARDAYQRARDTGLEVVFRSADPGLLGLPWELMRDEAGPVALAAGGVSRSLPIGGGAATLAAPGGRLRVLMVISRPAGTGDVGYQMVARPLLDRLAAVRGEVELVVLRPPTLDSLRATLAGAKAAGEPFQVVHFDGHGLMPGHRADAPGMAGAGRPAMLAGSGPEGLLAFERPGGGQDLVSASTLAGVVAGAAVPVVVLNACQSGAVGKDVEASVATALLRAGCAAVVAMAYSVYAVAAAEFMAVLYERLFAGDTISAAVTAGRRRLFENAGRPSPKGDLPLADWLVPVHYLRREVSFPQAHTSRPADAPSLDDALDQISAAAVEPEAAADPLAAVGGVFVGRDDLFYELEAAARLQHVVVLSGPGGTGKTELAKGFARWWRDTGGVDDPRLVYWHSFEPGVATFGLDGAITAFGLQVFGTDFARLDPPQRLAAVKQLLAKYRALLVWDNFESVREMPDVTEATPPLDAAGCAELKGFLDWAREHSRGAVIVTSRTQEDWLGPVRRIPVGGLDRAEAAQYADYLLAPYPAAQAKRERRSFGELLEWLDGHPLSIRLTLPRLDNADPADLLAELKGTAPLPAGQDHASSERLSSLGACITYSFGHLAEPTRRLLPAVSLFHGVADEDVLAIFSTVDGVPGRFTGIVKHEWTAVLGDAARVGLLASLGGGMYQIHPALPSYLAADWQADNPLGYDVERDAARNALCSAYADLSRWLTEQMESGNAAFAYAVIGLQRQTLGAMLGNALGRRMWAQAEGIVRALYGYWDSRGLRPEADSWADRILAAASGSGRDTPAEGSSATSLWLYTTGRQASRQQEAGRLDQAERAYRRLLSWLQEQPATDWIRANIAVAYHQLGITAQDGGRLDEAEDWYRQAMRIREELGLAASLSADYHQLGNTAYLRRKLDEADGWYRRAVEIREKLGMRALLATDYHQLGLTAQARDHLNDAETWFRKALGIFEELGDRPHAAAGYHQLGNLAYLRIRLDEAEDWYRRALTIKEALGDLPGMAITYGQLGLLAEARSQDGQALEWMVRCVSRFDQFPHPGTGPGPRHLARLTRQLGVPALAETWLQVTGQPVPQAVLDYIASQDNEE